MSQEGANTELSYKETSIETGQASVKSEAQHKYTDCSIREKVHVSVSTTSTPVIKCNRTFTFTLLCAVSRNQHASKHTQALVDADVGQHSVVRYGAVRCSPVRCGTVRSGALRAVQAVRAVRCGPEQCRTSLPSRLTQNNMQA